MHQLEPLESRTLFTVTTFTIDPTVSSLRLSGNVADVFDIEAQHEGSLTQFYTGSIVADVQGNADVISFPGGSSIVAQATRKYDPGSGFANYGVKGETGGVFSVKLGEGAVRNFVFDLESNGDLPVGGSGAFDAKSLRLHTTGGKLDYDLRVGGDGSVDLDGENVGNNAAGNATLRGEGENRTLTVPIDFGFDAGSTELRFRGTLVATTGTGAPIDPNVVRIGEGTLLRTATFNDPDGTLTTVTVSGGGSADVHFANAAQQVPGKTGVVNVSGTNVQLVGVDAVGTGSKTKVTVTCKGGTDKVVTVPSLTTDGAALSVGGKGVVFAGNVTINGALGTLSAARLSSATVTADSIGTFKVGGDVTSSTITLDAPFAAGTFAARSVAVSGGFVSSRLSTTGAIGSVKINRMSDSEIYSGVSGTAVDRFPQPSELSPDGSIASATVKSFNNSVIAADTLGRLKISGILDENGSSKFGLTADQIGLLLATSSSKQRMKLVAVTDFDTLTAQMSGQTFDGNDFLIRVE
jgi:hypothetical protein